MDLDTSMDDIGEAPSKDMLKARDAPYDLLSLVLPNHEVRFVSLRRPICRSLGHLGVI